MRNCPTCGQRLEYRERVDTEGRWRTSEGHLITISDRLEMSDGHLLNAHRLAVSVRLGIRTAPLVTRRKIQELLEEIARRGLTPIPVTDPPA